MTQSGGERVRVGIFGGSFNPPHIAHLIIAEVVREQFALDRILWIPTAQTPLKEDQELAGVEDRLAMTRTATVENAAFDVSDVEVRRGGVSYTADTIRVLQEDDREAAYHLIIGSDSLATMDRWHKPDEIVQRVPLIVFRRPGHDEADAPRRFRECASVADAPRLEISGTVIRRRIREGRSIRYMVTPPVYDYITAKGLYR